MIFIEDLIKDFASFVWGLPLLILLIGGGLYLLFRSQFLPFRFFGHAIQVLRGTYDDPNDPGQISHFQALTTALSATVGMGNISGVAVAIAAGGPGAIFWMWVSAIVGMATKFFTSTLAVLYRGKDSAGELQGGPMYFITEGLGDKWKPLAIFFSLCAMIGALPVFNVNQLTQAVNDILLIPNNIEVDLWTNLAFGLFLVIVTSFVILGGPKRIGKVTAKLVPSMVLLYFMLVSVVLFVYADRVPKYLGMIFTDAFLGDYMNPDKEALFGGVLGALIITGIKRGAFSNEAGIGTAPMAHGAAKTAEPVREGLVAMLGPFIDTIVVCTLTALTILVTGVWETRGSDGVTLTANAFSEAIPGVGQYILMVCIAVFSISSLFSYSYYGTKSLSFIVGAKYKYLYNYLFILSIVLGATSDLKTMISLIDGAFALMAIPTMLATVILAPKVVIEIRLYKERLQKERN